MVRKFFNPSLQPQEKQALGPDQLKALTTTMLHRNGNQIIHLYPGSP